MYAQGSSARVLCNAVLQAPRLTGSPPEFAGKLMSTLSLQPALAHEPVSGCSVGFDVSMAQAHAAVVLLRLLLFPCRHLKGAIILIT